MRKETKSYKAARTLWTTRAALVLLIAVAIVGCEKPDADGEKGGGDAAQAVEVKPMAVEVDLVRSQTFVQTLEFPGVAQPIDERTISAESGGRVTEAPAEEGETVKKGELLLRVDARTTTAQINLLQSQVSTAQREYSRLKKLAAEGLATPQQLDQLQGQVEQSELALKQARVGRGLSVVRSPFTGVVSMKNIEVGEFASPGQPIVQIIDTSTIKLEVTIPESLISYVKVGDTVDVSFSAVNKTVQGKIMRRGVTVAKASQTFPIEIHIPNEDGAFLPGMRARAIIPKLTIEDAVVVPRDALLEGVYQREAMVIEDRKGDVAKAALRVVQIGESRGNSVVITSGLQKGDVLITKGHRNVVDGTPVRIVRDRSKESSAPSANKEETSPQDAAGTSPKEAEEAQKKAAMNEGGQESNEEVN